MKRFIMCLIIAGMCMFTCVASAEIMKCDDDIIAFFQSQTETGFRMKTTSDMYERLTKDDWAVMHKLELSGGIVTARINASLDNYGTFEFSETERIGEPYEFARDDEAFNSAIKNFAENNVEDFSIVCTDTLYERITSDPDHLSLLTRLSKINTYEGTVTDNGSGVVCYFMHVGFTDDLKLLCKTKDDIKSAIHDMGSAGITDYCLVTDETLFAKLCQNGFEQLHAIEREAGLVDCDFYYNEAGSILGYKRVQCDTEIKELRTIADFCGYIEKCAANGDSAITAVCNETLYQQIESDSARDPELPLLWNAIQNAGIYRSTTRMNDDRKTVTINVTQYYPGMNIVRAYKSGDRSGLSEREAEALEECEALALLCAAETDLQTYINIHDAVCSRVSYSEDNGDLEKDTVIGALLNHRADCDGYADAYFAIATIAGLPVRYQCGATGPVGDDSGHMWNLVSIDGTWRAVDTTWDDGDSNIGYVWFNIGTDRLSVCHRWNQETTVTLCDTTHLTERPDREYLVDGEETVDRAIDDALQAGAEEFTLFFTEESENLYECVLTMLRDKEFNGVITYYWDDTMRSFTIELDDK